MLDGPVPTGTPDDIGLPRMRHNSDTPDANLAEEGFHQPRPGSRGSSGGAGGKLPASRSSHGSLLRRVQHTNGHKHGQVRSSSVMPSHVCMCRR